MSRHWSTVKESGSTAGMKLMLAIYRRLGELPFLLLLIPVSLYYWWRNPLARRASQAYQRRLRSAHPDAVLPRPTTLRHFMAFGVTMLDKVRALHGEIPLEQVDNLDRETMRAAIESGRGGVILVSHLGNHEICQALSALRPDLRLSLLMHTRHAQKFNALLRDSHRPGAVDIIEVSEIGPDTAQRLQRRIDEGGFVVIAADREPIGARGRARPLEFLGAPAAFPEGAFWLALLLRCPLYLLVCARHGRRYRVHFEALGDSLGVKRSARDGWIAAHMTRFAQRLEHYCVRYPLQWFNFYPFWQDTASAARDAAHAGSEERAHG